ncbi:MAG: heteromeric transposase endonuclease subunit TnsA [Blastocatellia bacterium]|nr:heteromeric transposase endonuclease subunit TnsA [Blastocatellia bacterium]
MKKSRYAWDEAKYKRFLKKEGRGQGTGQDYRPWLAIYDVSSTGRVHRIKGWKTNRTHHLLSDQERNFFYLLEWSDSVIDVREQFPLDLDETQLIAKDMGIKHPADQSSGFPWVFTTDFLITVRNQNQISQIARTVKPSDFLEKDRIIEKFELERRYWVSRGIDWGIVTEKDLPQVLVTNIGFIHGDYWLEATSETSAVEMLALVDSFKLRLLNYTGTVHHFTDAFDIDFNLKAGTALRLLKYLIAKKQVTVDMNEKIKFTKSVQSLICQDVRSQYKARIA